MWKPGLGIGTLALVMFCAPLPQLRAQEPPAAPAGQCWQSYTLCSEAAFGDEGWRSACYADFTGCIRPVRPAQCDPAAKAQCEAFVNRCTGIAGDDPIPRMQCETDRDACLLSFGC